MNLTECTLPIGDKIYLFADLIDYVSDQCDGDVPAPTAVTPEPITAAPTPVPTTATPAPTTATPTPTTVIASCTSAQLRYLLTSTYEAQCIADTGYSLTDIADGCQRSKILLLADLVDYVSDQCDATTPTPTTDTSTTEAPSPPTATPVTTCQTSVLSALLTDQYIDQCADASGYSFTSGTQPDTEEVAGMCVSSACADLLADVEALCLPECILSIGDKIYLFRDLVDYVTDQCSASTTTPTTETPPTSAPTSASPGTESPGTESPGSETPSATAPTSESPATLTPGTESPNTSSPSAESPGTAAPDTVTPTTESPATPTTETPEPTSPIHDAC
ncbi:hypothetical protein PC118_g13161 [Phytophthora cactorum]|uniref:Elicitin n=2 Tax=Phytophthora cactorum TaxID=29920 RepID=A0A8T1FRE3_9STRA|nr:hypothetical protein PC118_g13161 [Phytophthora cactorum]